MNQWLLRVKRLQQVFDERPDQRTPEMKLLQDEDWLRVAKNASLDSDEHVRRALADIRAAALVRFGSQLLPALRRFATSSNSNASATIFALAQFLEPGTDATLLERYELKKSSTSRGGTEWTVQNTTPVDADYDTRYQVRASSEASHGTGGLVGPMAWIPDFRERLQRAAADYRQVNKHTPPTGIADLLPFFSPPLDPATTDKVIKAYQERSQ